MSSSSSSKTGTGPYCKCGGRCKPSCKCKMMGVKCGGPGRYCRCECVRKSESSSEDEVETVFASEELIIRKRDVNSRILVMSGMNPMRPFTISIPETDYVWKKVSFVVDSGAEMNQMSEEEFEKLAYTGKKPKKKLDELGYQFVWEERKEEISGVGGTAEGSVVELEVSVFEGRKITMEFLIVAGDHNLISVRELATNGISVVFLFA